MSCVLLATCARLPAGDDDAAMLNSALADHGVQAQWAVWDDPEARWDALVVLRSTWDYTSRRTEFLAWADALERVANPADVVRWSSEKTYLRDLADGGIPIVESAFAAPGAAISLPTSQEYVVKPAVGAGSRGAGRFSRGDDDRARAHARDLHDAGLTVVVQPYLAQVDVHGETALIYLDGEFSHAIRKGPLLGADVTHSFTGDELYIPESIEARTPSAAELTVGASVVEFVHDRFAGHQLYLRVDLLPSASGPVVVELELVEPSLFLAEAPDAADRLAASIAARA